MGWLLVKTVLSLLAVVGLMGVVMVVMKRFVYGRSRKASAAVEVELLGSRVLQPKRSVFVLRVLDAVFVVGSSEEGLQTLARIGDSRSRALLDDLLARDAEEPRRANMPAGAVSSFAGMLGTLMGSKVRAGEAAGGKA
jgi:flagellar biogenesis protein FliO